METQEAITAKGFGADVSFDGRAITIKRGVLAKQGRGSRTVPVSQISGVDLRRPTLLNRSGAFALVVPGTQTRRTIWSAKRDEDRDENAVQFPARRLADFERVQAAILAAL